MKTVISIKKYRSQIAKAAVNKREAVRKAKNKKEQELTSNNRFKRWFDELWLAVEKHLRNYKK